MNEHLKKHLISAGITFASTFLTILGIQLSNGTPVQFTMNFILGIIFVAGRGAFKAGVEKWLIEEKTDTIK